jgi:hypothetical protein
VSIINDAYYEIIVSAGIFNHDDLIGIRDRTLLHPEKWEQAHRDFAEMWKALGTYGKAAFYEEMLDNLPSTVKPN